ncbi:MAG: hypothetical protein H8F28_10955 [Fibrella sp.]|nr:hypothetical protein [Armatimonadota bacterium]
MSDTPDAPLPHLGPPTPEQGEQAWSLPINTNAILELTFRWTADDYRRCYSRLILIRLAMVALISLGYGIFLSLSLVFFRYSRNMPLDPYVFVISLGIPIGFFVMYSATSFLSIALASWFVGATEKMPSTVSLSQEGVRETGRNTPRLREWSHIARIEERRGDIYVLMKAMRGSDLALPGAAFAGADAANRFRAALVALWQTNGNPNAVSAEIRGEFAPPI